MTEAEKREIIEAITVAVRWHWPSRYELTFGGEIFAAIEPVIEKIISDRADAARRNDWIPLCP